MGRIAAWDELSLFGIWDELSPIPSSKPAARKEIARRSDSLQSWIEGNKGMVLMVMKLSPFDSKVLRFCTVIPAKRR